VKRIIDCDWSISYNYITYDLRYSRIGFTKVRPYMWIYEHLLSNKESFEDHFLLAVTIFRSQPASQ